MKIRVIVAVAVCLLLGSGTRAEAKIWGWLEELSGPGPFERSKLYLVFADTTICFKGKRPDFSVSVDQPGKRCLYIETMTFESVNDNLVQVAAPNGVTSGGTIHVRTVEAGVSARVLPGVELGIGGGFIRFHTKETDHHATRLIVVPGRLNFTPSRFVAPLLPEQWTWIKYVNPVKFVVKSSIITGTLSGKDFGVEDSIFKETADFVGSYGVMIDVFEYFKK